MNNAIDQNEVYDDSTNLSFLDYIQILKFHWEKIIFITVITLFLAIYQTFTVYPKYAANASIMIKEKPGANMIMDVSGKHGQNRLKNEMQLIKSRAVAKEVVKSLYESDKRNNLHILGTRKFYPKGWRLRVFFRELFSLGFYEQEKDQPITFENAYASEIGERFAGQILKNLTVKSSTSTDVINLSYTSVNADEARKILNTIIKVYIELDLKWGSEDAVQSVRFLENLIQTQEGELYNAEERIRDFKKVNKMYDLQGNAGSFSSELLSIETEIYNISAEMNIRTEKRQILKSKLSNDEQSLADQLTNNINNQMLALREEISKLESNLFQNILSYGKNHSAVIELQLRIEALKSELDNKVSSLIDKGITVQDPLQSREDIITELLTLDSEILGLELKKFESQKIMKIFSDKLNKLPQKQLDFSRLERNLSVLTSNYTYLRQKLEEAKIKLASQSGKVQVLDYARKPQKALSPNHNKDILLGFIIGILCGISFVIVIEFLDNSIKNIEYFEKLGLSVLGIIPSIEDNNISDKTSLIFNLFNKKQNNKNSNNRRILITRENPRSPISEAYRSLRTSMIYSSANDSVKSIIVSSAGPGEGKTTTVANLAITYANLGKKTLIIDTDLRRPVVHKTLDLTKEPGITDYLTGNVKEINDLVQKTSVDNLFAIASGITPPNPSELLGSIRMANLVKKLESEWDMVLFDSPPLVAVTDARMVSKEIDKIIIVVKVGHTDKKAFSHTINSLRSVDAPIGGIILNAVSNKTSYGSYYYYYQYYNYYGSK